MRIDFVAREEVEKKSAAWLAQRTSNNRAGLSEPCPPPQKKRDPISTKRADNANHISTCPPLRIFRPSYGPKNAWESIFCQNIQYSIIHIPS